MSAHDPVVITPLAGTPVGGFASLCIGAGAAVAVAVELA
jgi:outer membrane lipoprotein SlyB